MESKVLPICSPDTVTWDEKIAGLGLRSRANSASWIYRYRFGGKQRSIKLGRAPSLSVVAARKAAEKLAAQIALGVDPAAQRECARIESETTVAVLAQRYIEAKKSGWRPRTLDEISRHIAKHLKPLHNTPIAGVSQRRIAELLNGIAESSGPMAANRVRSTLTALFGWAMREGINIPQGNIASLTNVREEKSRDRVLTDAELNAIWIACPDSDFGAIVKLLILTGQRRTEIGGLRWDEISDDEIVLPVSRTKNKRPHIIPLSEPAKAIIAGIERGGRQYLFGRGPGGFTDWSKSKAALDARRALPTSAEAGEWILHDLRRTAVTRMAELGVQPHIIEAVINHVSGHKGGVAGIYNRATYAAEKRAALNLWGEHVTALVEDRKATVVPMRRA
jgi:integrase